MTDLLEGHPRPFDAAATIKLTSETYAEFLQDFDRPWPEHKSNFGQAVREDAAAWPKPLALSDLADADEETDEAVVSAEEFAAARSKLRGIDNPLGKLIAADPSDFNAWRRSWLMDLACWQATRLLLALRIRELQNGSLPASLDELTAAKLLDEMPLDPFSNRPFQYSQKGRLLQSAGCEGFDRSELIWKLNWGN